MRKTISVFAVAALLIAAAVAQDREKELARIQAASNVLNDIQAAPDKGIPAEIMGSAQCVAIVPSMLKGGFVVGASYGKGIATCRHGEQWSAPAPIRIEGGSWGLQIGGQAVDLIMLVMNDKGMNQLLQSKFKVGADVSAAAGPVGRHVEGTTDWKMRAQVLTYSRARGAFAGITLNGAVLRQDEDETVALYGRMIPSSQILSGSVPAPQGTQTFLADLSRYFRASQAGTVAGGQTTAPPQSGTTAEAQTTVPATQSAPGAAPATASAPVSSSTAATAPPSSPVGAGTTAPTAPPQAGMGSVATPPETSAGTAGTTANAAPGAGQQSASGASASAAGNTAPEPTEPATGTAATTPSTTSAGTTAQPATAASPDQAPGTSPRLNAGSSASTSGGGMTPADVKSSIEKALRDAPGLSSSGVIVNVTQTAVELTGSVPSAADKETVHRIAEQNAGGRKVDDAWLVVR